MPQESGAAGAKTEAVSFSIMLGEGSSVTIGGKEYEVAAFPVRHLGKAGKLLSLCPDMMISAALSASADGEVGSVQTADTLNKLMKQMQPGAAEGANEVTPEMMDYAFGAVAMSVTEEQAEAMTPLAVLALSRRHPGITAADIEDDLDVAAFLVLLCRIFAENQALRRRF